MEMYEELKGELITLARKGERGDPLVFAGRKAILDEVVGSTLSKAPTGFSGNTFLISGAPGAGKTALAREAARILKSSGAETLYCEDVPDDKHVQAVYREMLAALGGAPPPDSTVNRATVEASAKVLGLGGSKQTMMERRNLSMDLDVREIAALLGPKRIAKARPVCVLIDEAQNVKPETEAASLLRDLHTQNRLPVTLVCLGLDDLHHRLNKAEVSPRINERSRIFLGGYTPSEALECADASIAAVRALGVSGTEAQASAWAEALADAADCWPRHLQCYLNAAWEVLSEQPNRPSLANGLDEALNCGHRLRDAYYHSRIDLSELPLEIIGPVHALLKDQGKVHKESLLNEIDRFLDERLSERARNRVLGKFYDSEGIFKSMMHVGLIAEDANQMSGSPIPSMSDHIIETCRKHGIDLPQPDDSEPPRP